MLRQPPVRAAKTVTRASGSLAAAGRMPALDHLAVRQLRGSSKVHSIAFAATGARNAISRVSRILRPRLRMPTTIRKRLRAKMWQAPPCPRQADRCQHDRFAGAHEIVEPGSRAAFSFPPSLGLLLESDRRHVDENHEPGTVGPRRGFERAPVD